MTNVKVEGVKVEGVKVEGVNLDQLDMLGDLFDHQQFMSLHESMTYADYIKKVSDNPSLIRTAYQRLYDMIVADGVVEMKHYRRTYNHYKFFDRLIPVFGLEKTLSDLVQFIKGAAGGYGTEKRILLLHL